MERTVKQRLVDWFNNVWLYAVLATKVGIYDYDMYLRGRGKERPYLFVDHVWALIIGARRLAWKTRRFITHSRTVVRSKTTAALLLLSSLVGWWAVVYDVTQRWGGAEEGGWWYDEWTPTERRWSLSYADAERVAEQWKVSRRSRPRYHWRGGDPELHGDEVDVSGNVRISVQRGWPTAGDNWHRWE